MSEQDYNSKSYDEIFICDSSEIDSIKQHKKKNSATLVYTKLSNKNIYNLQLPNQEMGAYVLEENKSLFIPITFHADLPHLKYVNKMMHLYKDGTLTRSPSENNISVISGEMSIIFTNQHGAMSEYEIIRYETPKLECKVFKYSDKSYENNYKLFQTIREDEDEDIEKLIEDELELMSNLEKPNICFLQVELSKL